MKARFMLILLSLTLLSGADSSQTAPIEPESFEVAEDLPPRPWPPQPAAAVQEPATPTAIPTSTPTSTPTVLPTPTLRPTSTPTPMPTITPTPVQAEEDGHHIGLFSYYGRQPTDGTIAYRVEQEESFTYEELDQAAGVIALNSCNHIGKTVWVRFYGFANGGWMPVIVFDCAGHLETQQWMVDNKILGEIGYYLAESAGFYGLGPSQIPGEISYECPYCEQ